MPSWSKTTSERDHVSATIWIFSPHFSPKRNVFVFLLVSTSINSYQNQGSCLYAVYKNISSYLQVYEEESLVSVFWQAVGAFAYVQTTTTIYDEKSCHSLRFSGSVNTTTVLIKERYLLTQQELCSKPLKVICQFACILGTDIHLWGVCIAIACRVVHVLQTLLFESFPHIHVLHT